MLDAIAWIEGITADRGREDYLADRPLLDAVERNTPCFLFKRAFRPARHREPSPQSLR